MLANQYKTIQITTNQYKTIEIDAFGYHSVVALAQRFIAFYRRVVVLVRRLCSNLL